MSSVHSNRGAKRAREAREELGLGLDEPLACVLTAVEERGGVPVCVLPMGDGIAGAFRPRPPLVFVNGEHAVVRQRFTVAHEFGHHRLRHSTFNLLDTPEDLAGRTHDPLEVEANAFAAEFLAPRRAVCRLWEEQGLAPDLEGVCRLAACFGISALAALFRLDAAELVGAGQRTRLREEIDEGLHAEVDGWLDVERCDDELQALAAGGEVRLPASMRDSALGAMLAGELTLEEAAERAGRSPDEVRAALEALGI